MIELLPQLLIGSGRHRECYQHPEDPSLCIKITVRGDAREDIREQKYYKILEKRGGCWDIVARYYGIIDTQKGPGGVYDLVHDYDGSISRSVEAYCTDSHVTEDIYDQMCLALGAAYERMRQYGLLTLDLQPYNLLFQRTCETEGRIIIIDNIGTNDFIPICYYSRFFARMKIRRKWRKFRACLARRYGDNAAVHSLLKKLPE